MAVRVIQVEHVHGIPGQRVEERLLRRPRPLAPQLPPEIPRVQHAPEIAAEEVHERTCSETAMAPHKMSSVIEQIGMGAIQHWEGIRVREGGLVLYRGNGGRGWR